MSFAEGELSVNQALVVSGDAETETLRQRVLNTAYDLYRTGRDAVGIIFSEHTARGTVDVAIEDGVYAAWQKNSYGSRSARQSFPFR